MNTNVIFRFKFEYLAVMGALQCFFSVFQQHKEDNLHFRSSFMQASILAKRYPLYAPVCYMLPLCLPDIMQFHSVMCPLKRCIVGSY